MRTEPHREAVRPISIHRNGMITSKICAHKSVETRQGHHERHVETSFLRDAGCDAELAGGEPSYGEGAPCRLLQAPCGRGCHAQHYLAGIGRRSSLLRMDRRDPPD